jgi:hypothetical protein
MIGANTTITSKRIAILDDKESYSTNVLSSQEAYIEPMSDEAVANYADENVFALFDFYADGVLDIIISDLIIDLDNNQYTVKGVKKFKGGDVPSHTEAVLVLTRDYA